ncbi:DNA replication/repair protein RecF [Novilysobacter spongiicola]|uniref:DNA replication and repair protein RecF n=1 Tax=Lysobacter spongiicola DSM 21749 TaxID=1122188 RepID=A0A1T4Q038_9GAMM|nr:DNA replication/repair protein RecF [Lysobacter spongiicola]SJZ97135.1 DNA replication and repair protein RecF [Lysobacter spongiicola DSM 21749]
MYLTRLDIRNFRGFEQTRLAPEPGFNLITGGNGAGKTTLLEAMHLMSYGRSFRGRVRDGLVRGGTDQLEVFVEWRVGDPATDREVSHRAGLRHSGSRWEGRLDGQDVSNLGELCAALSVVSFEPGSHALVTGPAEVRRRFVDWGLFHVEPGFLPLWRRYARALKQRNALLKARAPMRHFEPWDAELVLAGEALDSYRASYIHEIAALFSELVSVCAPSLGRTCLEHVPGWRREEVSLADALLLSRDRDLLTGHTSVGPHRADWRICLASLPGREALSRGQAKLIALAALLSQAEHQAAKRGSWPVFLLDDLGSELDRAHRERVLGRVLAYGAQIFVTGTEADVPGLTGIEHPVFHVEHGSVQRLQ